MRTWNDISGGRESVLPAGLTASDMFDWHAARQPQAPAVRCDDDSLTYGGLQVRRDGLAGALQAAGLGAGCLVGLYLERSVDMIVAILAIWKAGAAYVPLEPELPVARLTRIVEATSLQAVISRPPLTAPWPVPVVDPTASAPLQLTAPPTPDELAYVLFTSGSTGTPKGVAVTHRGLANLARHEQLAYDTGPSARVLQFASIGFDTSVSEITMALCSGGALEIVPTAARKDPDALAALIRDRDVTTMTLTPSMLGVLDPDHLPSLRTVISAGEACSGHLVARWLGSPGRRFMNAYGPTETTVCCAIDACAAEEAPLLGPPLPEVDLFVLDEDGAPVKPGEAGDLHIGGRGVARGYWRDPIQTAERYLPHPTAPGQRVYRTGDLVRVCGDGRLAYLGRADRQVKRNGVRVELGEIEGHLERFPGVVRAAVVERDGVLIAWVTGTGLAEASLRDRMQAELPPAMVPARVVPLPSLPLTTNGKVDYRALPAPPRLGEAIPPRDALEHELLEIWRAVLPHADDVGVRDDFFACGGTSILAIRALSAIHRRLGRDLGPSALLRWPTVEKLAVALRDHAKFTPLLQLTAPVVGSTLILVHPIGGNLLCYSPIARALEGRLSVYGLQSYGLFGDDRPLQRIEEMAARYLEAVADLPQPHVFAGWSSGGVVAFEMARQSPPTARPPVLLLDTDIPQGREAPDDDVVYLAMLARQFALPLSPAQLRAMPDEQRFTRFLEMAARTSQLPLDLDETQARRMLEVYKANVRAEAAWRPAPLEGRGVFVGAWFDVDHSRDWDELFTEGLEKITVPGTHFTMVDPPHADTTAQALLETVARVCERCAAPLQDAAGCLAFAPSPVHDRQS